MIRKTIDGHETTVHPSMEQAAIDQGIRPVGYDDTFTPMEGTFDCAKGLKELIEDVATVENMYAILVTDKQGDMKWFISVDKALDIVNDKLLERSKKVKNLPFVRLYNEIRRGIIEYLEREATK